MVRDKGGRRRARAAKHIIDYSAEIAELAQLAAGVIQGGVRGALTRRAVSRMLVTRTFRVWDHDFKRGRLVICLPI